MLIRKMWKIELGLIAVTGFVVGLRAQAPGAGANRSATGDKQSTLVAQGKARFQAYKCYDCHGQNGEGTDEAPDLTHSKLTAEQVSKFLQKPSVDAQNKGMPDVPTDSPDHQPLVAYVMSLRASGNGPTGTAAAKSGAPPSKPATPKGATGSGPTSSQQSALVAQGKARFQAYKCYDCHGQNGEGTDEAPDLTHSKLTAEQVSKFLQKPSVDAQNKGMPDVPTDSPDHQPLVAYVMSLRAK